MNKNNSLRTAVIGCGSMGMAHVRNYAEIEGVELAAAADCNGDICDDIAGKYKIKFYEDYAEMLDKEKPDIVSVCVPTALHLEVARACIEKKINVLLEKPIAMNLGEGQEVLDLAKKHGVKLLVGHIERFNPAVNRVKKMIKDGELGQVTAIMARRVGGFPSRIKDADIAVDLAIHDVDIVNFLLDELPEKVAVHRQRNHIEQRDDAVEFFLQYKHSSAYIQTNWISPVKIRKLNITGSDGYLEMDYITQEITFYKSNYEKFKEPISGFSDYILRFSEPDKVVISVAKKEPLRQELLYLVDCVRNDKEIDSTFALDALRIVTQ